MLRSVKLCRLGALPVILFLAGTALAGQKSQKNAAYSRTMDDLRLARALLVRTTPVQSVDGSQDEVSLSVSYISAAMDDIYKETGTQGEKPQGQPQVDPRMKWSKRLEKSLKLLEKAQLDCKSEKAGSRDNGLQARVADQLDHAHSRLTVAVNTVNFDYTARNLPTRND